MNETQWVTDMKKSTVIARQALPIFKMIFDDKDLQILQVEEKNEEVCRMLDRLCGIDYFLLKSNRQTYGVAWRCQWVEPGKEYNSFTIRKSRDSGIETEYEKRKKAIAQESIYPYYVAQAFVNKYTNEIISLAVTTTKDELEYLDNPNTLHEVRHTGADQIGQAEFYVIYWIDMRLFGYPIRIYKQNYGLV